MPDNIKEKLPVIKRCPVVLPADDNGFWTCCNEPSDKNRLYCLKHYEEYVEQNRNVLGPYL